VTQTLDVLVPGDIPKVGQKGLVGKGVRLPLNGKTGAETARNGHSFPAIIEKMIAGATEGREAGLKAAALKTAGKGAGSASGTPGDGNTLIKHGPAIDAGTEALLKNGKVSSKTVTAKGAKKAHSREDDESAIAQIQAMFAQNAVPQDQAKITASAEGKTGEGVSDEKASPEVAAKKSGRGGTASGAGDAGVPSGIERLLAGSARAADDTSAGKGETSVRVERKDKKTVIGVRDERKTQDAQDAVTDSPFAKSVEIREAGVADMTIGFRGAENGSHSLAGETDKLADRRDAEGKNFASMLSQELRNNAADFVKTGHIILKDNNAGLIRLTLNPESLGNVKISLELSGDKKISGKIVVDSQEAYEAFNENLQGLSQAFIDGGFQSAGFDLSWSGQGSENRQQEAEAAIRAPFYASSIPDVMSGNERADTQFSGYRPAGSSAINVFA
jgi:flagellar hook-length control protein FliK